MALHALNDQLKVEIKSDEYGFAGRPDEQEGTETGIVVEVPTLVWYLGFHSFAFEESFGAGEKIAEIVERVRELLLGKRVYWTAYSERGSVLKEGNKTYAFVKITDLIAFDDETTDTKATSVAIKERKGVALK